MANAYKQLTDKHIEILTDNMTTNLSTDMSTEVVGVHKGHFTPTAAVSKPCVFVRPEFPSLLAEFSGALSRHEAVTFIFTCAVDGTDRDTVWDDLMCLVNNIENLLHHYTDVTGYWSGGHLGMGLGDESNPEPFGKFEPGESVGGRIVAHASVRWTVFARIGRDNLQ